MKRIKQLINTIIELWNGSNKYERMYDEAHNAHIDSEIEKFRTIIELNSAIRSLNSIVENVTMYKHRVENGYYKEDIKGLENAIREMYRTTHEEFTSFNNRMHTRR